jgi:hypothetical protein
MVQDKETTVAGKAPEQSVATAQPATNVPSTVM